MYAIIILLTSFFPILAFFIIFKIVSHIKKNDPISIFPCGKTKSKYFMVLNFDISKPKQIPLIAANTCSIIFPTKIAEIIHNVTMVFRKIMLKKSSPFLLKDHWLLMRYKD